MEPSSHTLEELADLYLVSCQVEGRSPNTVRAYRETLELFLRAATELNIPESASEVTSEHIYRYLSWVMQRGVSLPTRHRRFREVRCFFNWCQRMKYTEGNPFKGLRNVRLGQKIVQPFSAEMPLRFGPRHWFQSPFAASSPAPATMAQTRASKPIARTDVTTDRSTLGFISILLL